MKKKKLKHPLLKLSKSSLSYSVLLKSKQAIQIFYNFKNKQLKNYYNQAKKKQKNTQEILQSCLIQSLEQRLDVILYRSKTVKTLREAKNRINQKQIKVCKMNFSKNYASPKFQTTKNAHYPTQCGDKIKLLHAREPNPNGIHIPPHILRLTKNIIMITAKPQTNTLYYPFVSSTNSKTLYTKNQVLNYLRDLYKKI